MHLSANIVHSVQIVINRRWMVLLGLGTGVFGVSISLLWLIIRFKLASNYIVDINVEEIFQEATKISLIDVIGGTIIFVLTALVLWLLATLAECALIVTVQNTVSEVPISFGHSIKASWHYLSRLIGVDTILFFPIFLLLMLPFFIVTVSLAGLVWKSDVISGRQILILVGVVLLLETLLLCLIIFLTLVIFMWRILTFRAVVINALSSWRAIKLGWQLGRQHLGEIILVGLFVLLCRFFAGLPSQILGVLSFLWLTFSKADPFIIWVGSGQIKMIIGFIWFTFLIVSVLVGAFLNTFASTLWTLSYREWDGIFTSNNFIHDGVF